MKRKIDLSYQQLPAPTKIKDAIERLGDHPNDDLWQALDAAISEIGESRPKDSFTMHQLAEQKGLSRDGTYRLLAKLIKAGKVVRHGKGNTTFYSMVR